MLAMLMNKILLCFWSGDVLRLFYLRDKKSNWMSLNKNLDKNMHSGKLKIEISVLPDIQVRYPVGS